MIDRSRRRDPEAALFRAAHYIERIRTGDGGGVVAATGEFDEPDVALEHDGLGGFRHAGETEAGRKLACVHNARAGKVLIFGVMDDERIEVARIGECTAEDVRVHHALRALGEGDGACGPQEADLGHLVAFEPLGECSHRMDVHDRVVARAAEHEVDGCGIVDRRIGFGLADDRGDAACGCRVARGSQRLAMFGAGLADEGAHVDQAGGHDLAVHIDDLGAFRRAGCADVLARLLDHAVRDQDIAALVEVARRIDHAGIRQEERAVFVARDHLNTRRCSMLNATQSATMKTSEPMPSKIMIGLLKSSGRNNHSIRR